MIATNLDQYLTLYGEHLGKAGNTLDPLHVPSTDTPHDPSFMRPMFDPQAHAATAAAKQLQNDSACLLVAECGTGKTIMAQGVAQLHAQLSGNSAYRAIVMCPPQLVGKWIRELEETIPGVVTHEIRTVRDLLRLDRHSKPAVPEWFVMSEQTAKGDVGWKAAYNRGVVNLHKAWLCPKCGRPIVDNKGITVSAKAMQERQHWCVDVDSPSADPDFDGNKKGCGEPLWQWDRKTRKWAPATFIHKKLKGYFDYAIFDEVHEEKSPTSARANALGTLAAACRKSIGLTGTLIGGYAWHLRTLLLRLSPTSLVQEGFDWANVTAFNVEYGRIETRITTKDESILNGERNRRTRGKQTKTQSVRPGIMPTIFGRHLIDKCVFLSLDELADNLPVFEERVVPVKMDSRLAEAYANKVEVPLRAAVAEMVQRGDRRLLAAMLQTLIGYPDMPHGWGTVGYRDRESGFFIPVCDPPDLDLSITRNKERELIDLVLSEYRQGRQVWVYTTMTGERDVADRLDQLLKAEGLRSKILRSSVSTRSREEWINRNAPDVDVMISHPQLVQTGLDLFDKHGRHNFPTLIFYSTGYNLFTLRQAARRAWRIGQQEACRVYYLYYENTMQARAMSLMGQKLTASEAIEGKFSAEGLAAMGGDEGSMEMALAKSLINKITCDAQRDWRKVTQGVVGNPKLGRCSAGTVNRLNRRQFSLFDC